MSTTEQGGRRALTINKQNNNLFGPYLESVVVLLIVWIFADIPRVSGSSVILNTVVCLYYEMNNANG